MNRISDLKKVGYRFNKARDNINMAVEVVHRHAWYTGKNLINILTELPNYGIGRLVTRRRWTRLYPADQPSYYKITRVKIDCTKPELDRGEVWGICTYKGYRREGLEVRVGAWWKKEWDVIRKTDEEEFCQFTPKPEDFHVAPTHARMPPLLEAMTRAQRKGDLSGDNNDPPLLKLHIRRGYRQHGYQIENDVLVGDY